MGIRASYPILEGGLATEPSEVISKQRLDDINIKCDTKNVLNWKNQIFTTDIRISCSREAEKKLDKKEPVPYPHQERMKERSTFKFQFMKLDFTKTNQRDLEVPLSQGKQVDFSPP